MIVASGLIPLFVASGCALLGMRSPKTDDPSMRPDCSESRTGVAVDGVLVAAYGLLAFAGLNGGEDGLLVGSTIVGGIHLASAVAGSRSANRCTAAHQRHEDWVRKEQLAQPASGRVRGRARTGTRGGRCYGNRTCNDGLFCDIRNRTCVPAPSNVSPAELRRFQKRADTGSSSTATSGRPGDQPRTRQSGPARRPVERKPARASRPRPTPGRPGQVRRPRPSPAPAGAQPQPSSRPTADQSSPGGSGGKTADKPASRPADKPANRPADKPASRPADKPANRPADKPDKPADKPAPTEPDQTEDESWDDFWKEGP